MRASCVVTAPPVVAAVGEILSTMCERQSRLETFGFELLPLVPLLLTTGALLLTWS